jgi:predicted PurR-regulated permease PerM
VVDHRAAEADPAGQLADGPDVVPDVVPDADTAAPPAPAPPGPDGDGPVRVLVDIDPWSFVAVGAAALVAVALFSISSVAADVLTGIGVGVLLGVALSPVVSKVQQRWHTSRGSAVVIVGFGLTVAITVVVVLVAPAAIRQSREFSEELPSTVRDFYSWPVIGPRLEDADAAGRVEEWIADAPARIDDATLADLGERLLGGVLSTVIVLITALGVMVDGAIVVRRFRALVPPERREGADRMGRIIYATFGSYFAGSLFVAVLAGLWTTLTNLIPQIGGLLGGGFFVLLALTQGPVQAAIALAVFITYQNLENHVIQPAIVGRAVNLSPPTTMLAALVGAAAGGVPGALVATPLLGAAKAVYLDRQGRMPEPETEVVRRRLSGLVRRRFRRGDPPG